MFSSLFLIALYTFIEPLYSIDINKDTSLIKESENGLTIVLNVKKNSIKCGTANENSKIKYTNSIYGKCTINANKNEKNIYLKKGPFKRKITTISLLFKNSLPKKIFIALNEEKNLNSYVNTSNSPVITYQSSDEKIVSTNKDKFTGKSVGKTTVTVVINNYYQKDIEVEVSSLIVQRPNKYNHDKKYLPCNRYTNEENKKLEEILENRIENVGGYGTRAAVVESIRFLMLDFPYQIDYFFENRRLSGGVNYVDGEGRYYHKGLYLSEDKFKDIKKSYSGPAIWGCPLRNFEDYKPKYKKGSYNSNGLDCSGFVSWAILNGGFDIGDRGAGDNLQDDGEINDIGGKKEDVSVKLIRSGNLKAGDLLGIWGHIAIVAGIDDENVYVAESLWTFGGPVINTYKHEDLRKHFVQAVLLDDLYKKDGLYTSLWY